MSTNVEQLHPQLGHIEAPADCVDEPGSWYPWDDTYYSRCFTAGDRHVGEIRVEIAGMQFSDGRRHTLEIRCIGDLDSLTVDQTRRLSAALLDAADRAEKMVQPG